MYRDFKPISLPSTTDLKYEIHGTLNKEILIKYIDKTFEKLMF